MCFSIMRQVQVQVQVQVQAEKFRRVVTKTGPRCSFFFFLIILLFDYQRKFCDE